MICLLNISNVLVFVLLMLFAIFDCFVLLYICLFSFRFVSFCFVFGFVVLGLPFIIYHIHFVFVLWGSFLFFLIICIFYLADIPALPNSNILMCSLFAIVYFGDNVTDNTIFIANYLGLKKKGSKRNYGFDRKNITIILRSMMKSILEGLSWNV